MTHGFKKSTAQGSNHILQNSLRNREFATGEQQNFFRLAASAEMPTNDKRVPWNSLHQSAKMDSVKSKPPLSRLEWTWSKRKVDCARL